MMSSRRILKVLIDDIVRDCKINQAPSKLTVEKIRRYNSFIKNTFDDEEVKCCLIDDAFFTEDVIKPQESSGVSKCRLSAYNIRTTNEFDFSRSRYKELHSKCALHDFINELWFNFSLLEHIIDKHYFMHFNEALFIGNGEF